MYISIRSCVSELEMKAGNTHVEHVVLMLENEQIERLSLLKDELGQARETYQKLLTMISSMNSKIALIRAERKSMRKQKGRLRKELILLETLTSEGAEMDVSDENPSIGQPVEIVRENGDRYLKVISDLEDKLRTLDRRLARPRNVSRNSKSTIEPGDCFARIRDVLGPLRSHHSELKHQEREEILNLLLSNP
jgi:hypothetical protein